MCFRSILDMAAIALAVIIFAANVYPVISHGENKDVCRAVIIAEDRANLLTKDGPRCEGSICRIPHGHNFTVRHWNGCQPQNIWALRFGVNKCMDIEPAGAGVTTDLIAVADARVSCSDGILMAHMNVTLGGRFEMKLILGRDTHVRIIDGITSIECGYCYL